MSITINGGIIITGGLNINPYQEGVSLTNIIFANLVNFQESPAGVWGPVSVGTADYYGGKATTILSSGNDGYVQYDITDNLGDLNNLNTGIGFALSDILIPGDNYDYFIYVEGANGNYKSYDAINGYIDSGILANTGDKVKLERIGSTITAKYLRSSLWTDIIIFPTTTTSTLYLYGGGFDIGQFEYLVNPVGFGLT